MDYMPVYVIRCINSQHLLPDSSAVKGVSMVAMSLSVEIAYIQYSNGTSACRKRRLNDHGNMCKIVDGCQ
jgi:hypothetical protein